MILTPDQRLRIFVSSTLGELVGERAAVRGAIESMRFAPVMFELGARPHPPRALYRAYLEQSHVFVAIYAERYGWVAPGMEISGLEDEYRLSGRRPKLVYVKEPAPGREARLAAMLEEVRADPIVTIRTYRSPAELADRLAEDLSDLVAGRFASAAAAEQEQVGATPAPPTLPAATTPLVGRTRELDEVAGLLRRPDVRLVTLTGIGGIGKSRLALEIAHRVAPDFAGGVVLVPLAVVPEAGLVLTSVAGALAVQLDHSRPAIESIADAVADRGRLLVVLDNAEHVADAADDLAALVGTCPDLALLVTSRKRLRLAAEHDYPLQPLDTGEPDPGIGFGGLDRTAGRDLTGSDAVRLFLVRARSAQPIADLDTAAELAAIAELCRRLDGLPLAIEIAAARVRLLAPSSLLDRLDGRLDLPPARLADLPERQRTLRATLEWSHDLLPAAERRLFAQLSTFVGGASLDAIERVCSNDGDLLESLATLADHSLLDVDATAMDAPRFRMLGTVRDYARERLEESGEADEVDLRHRAWVVDLADRARAALPGVQQTAWCERLELESGNIRVAGTRAYAAGDPGALAHVGFCLWIWLWLRHHVREGSVWLERALDEPERLDPLTRARVLWAMGAGALEEGDYARARVRIAAADRMFVELGDAEGIELGRFMRACLAPVEDRNEEAIQLFDECLARLVPRGEFFLASICASTCGMVLAQQGRLDEAESRFDQALELAARIDNPVLIGSALVSRGFARLARASLDEAVRDLAEGARLAHDGRNAESLAYACDGLAAVRLAGNRADTVAAELVGGAVGLRERAGIAPWPALRPFIAAIGDGVRVAVGDATFGPARDRGRRRSFDAVYDLVLTSTADSAAPVVDPAGSTLGRPRTPDRTP